MDFDRGINEREPEICERTHRVEGVNERVYKIYIVTGGVRTDIARAG